MTGINDQISEIEESVTTSSNIGERKPYVFLLSDGGATKGYSQWWDNNQILSNSAGDLGTGAETGVVGAALQLKEVTASLILSGAYMKEQLTSAYNAYNTSFGYNESEAKFYTVGLGSDINNLYTDNTNRFLKYAWLGLEPAAISKAISNTPLWSEDQVWAQEHRKAATNVLDQINTYVDAAVTAKGNSFEKYRNEEYYDYTKFYTYADNYDNLQKAFSSLANDVEAETKFTQPPVIVDEGTQASIFYHDTIGEGMELAGPLNVTLGKFRIEGELDAGSSTTTKKTYKFDNIEGKAVVTVDNDGTAKSIDWYISGHDLKEAMYTIKNNAYVSKNPLTLDYDLKLAADLDASDEKVYYTNTISKTGSDIQADTYVTFSPTTDNPYYYYTNSNTGKIGELNAIGFTDIDTEITHYVKGTTIANTSDLTALHDVYITIDIANAAGDAIKLEQVGTVLASLPAADKLPVDLTDFKTALGNSIQDCVQNADGHTNDGTSTYAFLLGIPKAHEHEVKKAENANISETTEYLSKEHFENGKINMKLGNNGRAEITHDIEKTVSSNTVVPGDTITYSIEVHNYTDVASTGLTIQDEYPAGLTNVTNLFDTTKASFSKTGNTVQWTGLSIPAKTSVTLSFSAKVPSAPTVTKYENEAKITKVNNKAITNPATSNKVKSDVKSGIKITVNKDDTAWNDHNKTLKLKASNGTIYALSDNLANGTYTIMDGNTDTSVSIAITDRSGSATLDYYTLTLNKGTGIASVSETGKKGSAGTNANEYIFLKGQVATIQATPQAKYAFVNWTGASAKSAPVNASLATTTIKINDKVTLRANAEKMANVIELDINLNDAPYQNYDKEITYVDKNTNAVITDLKQVPDGDYIVYVDGEETNVTFVADGTKKTIALDYYTLTVAGTAGISGTAGSGNYLKGTEVSIESYLDANHHFVKWNGDILDTNTMNKNTVKVDAKKTVTAEAATPANAGINVKVHLKLDNEMWNEHAKVISIKDSSNKIVDPGNVTAGTYTIFDDDQSTGMQITITEDQVTANEDQEIILDYYSLTLRKTEGIKDVLEENAEYVFLKGSNASINTTLEDNYQFTGWKDASGKIVYPSIKNTIVMNQKTDLTANALEVYNVQVDVKLDGSAYTGFDKTITLKDSSGNIITDLTSVPNGEYTVIVDDKETYLKVKVDKQAQNVQLEYFTLTLQKGTGIESISGNGIYLKGDKVKIQATEQHGYQFKNWTGSNTLNEQESEITVNSTLSLTANAEKDIQSSKVTIEIYKDGSEWLEHGKTITLKNSDGKMITDFSKLMDGTYTVYVDGESIGKTITVNGEDSTLRLNYFTLALYNGLGIHSTSGSGIYLEGSEVAIDAMVMDGYVFSGWSGSQSYTSASQRIKLTQPLTLTANATKLADSSNSDNNSNNNDSNGNKGTSPGTGDNTLTTLYLELFLASGLLIMCIQLRKKINKG